MTQDKDINGQDSSPVTREELYQKVWAAPMTAVARQYGVSSSYMARVCTRLNVPRPDRGYWAKRAAGQTVEPPDIPDTGPGDELEWVRDGQSWPEKEALPQGAVTSGIGYAIWYSALGGLTATQAAVVQLFVPVIAALGGTVFGGESISLRLVISSLLILGGGFAVVAGRAYTKQKTANASTESH
ncbi:MAG: hypothetical protein ACI92E_000923 [Oceanicoccus sp.]|jgi:hypothetical protein